jgi:hypothetical protein
LMAKTSILWIYLHLITITTTFLLVETLHDFVQ